MWSIQSQCARAVLPAATLISAVLCSPCAFGDEVVDTIPIGDLFPLGVAVNSQNNRVYVPGFTFTGERVLHVVDGNTVTAISLGDFDPLDIGIDSQRNRVYLTGRHLPTGEGLLAVVDGCNDSLRTIPLGAAPLDHGVFSSDDPALVAINSQTNRVYIAAAEPNEALLAVFDGNLDAVTPPIHLSLSPFEVRAIALNDQTNRIFVATRPFAGAEGLLLAVSGEDHSITSFPLGLFDPLVIAVNPKTNRVYMAGPGGPAADGLLAVFDANDNSLSTVPLGIHASAIGVNPETNRVFLLGSVIPTGERVLAIVSGLDHSTTVTPLADVDPVGIAVNPKANRVYIPAFRFTGERVLLVVGPLVCSSNVSDFATLRAEVNALSTSTETIGALLELLDLAQATLNLGKNRKARRDVEKFIDKVVGHSNLVATDPDMILFDEANSLICGAANLLMAIRP